MIFKFITVVTFITVVVFSGSAEAYTEDIRSGSSSLSCLSCHSSDNEGQCSRCHAPSLIPKSWAHLYRRTAKFDTLSTQHLKRYNCHDLKKYLASPYKRTNDPGHMFPVHTNEVPIAIKALGCNDKPNYLPEDSRQQDGKKIYESLGCDSCHSDSEKAPLIKLPYALINFDYFKARIKGQSPRVFPHYGQSMPTFSLKDEELKSLYSYLFTQPITPKATQRASKPNLKTGIALHDEVMSIFQKNGCVHCHGKHSTQDVEKTFGGNSEEFVLGFDKQKEKVFFQGKKDILAPAHGGKPPKLMQVLEERRHELSNEDTPSIRGMPLTGNALSVDDIQAIKRWLRLGCPSPDGLVCSSTN